MSWTAAGERGSLLGMRSVIWCLRRFGLRAARAFVEPVIVYFFLTGHAARRASLRYLARLASTPEGRAALGRRPGAWASYQHFRAFGHSLVDRVCFWGGMTGRFVIDFPRRPEFLALRASGRGALLLGAHIGAIDVMRALAKHRDIPVHLLIFDGNAKKITAVLKTLDPDLDLRVIRVEEGSIDAVIELGDRIQRGEFVAILGDRAELSSEKRKGRAPFLGSAADFPLGPLWIAHALGCPVVLLFALRRGANRYEIVFEPFADRIVLDRRHRERDQAEWLARYVAKLEEQCLAAPLQWFNFYDFWGDEAPARRGSESSPPARAGAGRREREAFEG